MANLRITEGDILPLLKEHLKIRQVEKKTTVEMGGREYPNVSTIVFQLFWVDDMYDEHLIASSDDKPL
jgi:hypothetical protein